MTEAPNPVASDEARSEGVTPDEGIVRFFAGAIRWLTRNTIEVVLYMVAGFVLAFIGNFLMMMFIYDGYNKTIGTPATGAGNIVPGMLIWTMVTSVIIGLVAYRRAVGKERFWRGIGDFPAQVAGAFQQDTRVWAHLFWGGAISLIIAQFISPWMALAVAGVVTSTVLSPVGQVVASLIVRLWSLVMRELSPARDTPLRGPAGLFVSLLTVAFGLGVCFFMPNKAHRLLIALGLIVAAVILGRRPSRVTAALVMLAGGSMFLMLPELAHADDGGFKENGQNFAQWMHSEGAWPLVKYCFWGGWGGATGGFFGGLHGSGSGSIPEIRPWGDPIWAQRVPKGAHTVTHGPKELLNRPLGEDPPTQDKPGNKPQGLVPKAPAAQEVSPPTPPPVDTGPHTMERPGTGAPNAKNLESDSPQEQAKRAAQPVDPSIDETLRKTRDGMRRKADKEDYEGYNPPTSVYAPKPPPAGPHEPPTMARGLQDLYEKKAQLDGRIAELEKAGKRLAPSSYDELAHLRTMRDDNQRRIDAFEGPGGADAVNDIADQEKRNNLYRQLKTVSDYAGGEAVGRGAADLGGVIHSVEAPARPAGEPPVGSKTEPTPTTQARPAKPGPGEWGHMVEGETELHDSSDNLRVEGETIPARDPNVELPQTPGADRDRMQRNSYGEHYLDNRNPLDQAYTGAKGAPQDLQAIARSDLPPGEKAAVAQSVYNAYQTNMDSLRRNIDAPEHTIDHSENFKAEVRDMLKPENVKTREDFYRAAGVDPATVPTPPPSGGQAGAPPGPPGPSASAPRTGPGSTVSLDAPHTGPGQTQVLPGTPHTGPGQTQVLPTPPKGTRGQ